MVTKDIGDGFAAILHTLEEVLHVVGRVLALVDFLYRVGCQGFVFQFIYCISPNSSATDEKVALSPFEENAVAIL